MKSNAAVLERPPRTSAPIPGAPWRVQRLDDSTRIWFAGVMTAPPDETIEGELSDEQVDALKIAYARGERDFSGDRVRAVLSDPDIQAARLDHYRAHAPKAWRASVGLE